MENQFRRMVEQRMNEMRKNNEGENTEQNV